ncbi:MAG: hypothetical protein A2293_11635 [Elusimicrobia bacterium RIFOXYB2_FULL_49_7]|nr:MAG: hypothetical protein A2293_11635 [Elusimicrobia bacterium RIFOXYB2_FULL_49_7]
MKLLSILILLFCVIQITAQDAATLDSQPAIQGAVTSAQVDENTLLRGEDLFTKQLYAKAREVLEAVVAKNPNEAKAWRLLREIYSITNDKKLEIQALEKYAALSPTKESIGQAIDLFKEMGDSAKALFYLEQYAKLKPEETDKVRFRRTLDELALVYEKEQKTDELYGTLKKLIDIAPKNEHYHFKKGNLDFSAGKYKEAFSEFKEVDAISPGYNGNAYPLGESAYRTGNWIVAVEALKKAKVENPDSQTLFLHLGEAFEALKQPTEAASTYETLLNLNPKNPDVISKLIALYEKDKTKDFRLVKLYEDYQELTGKSDPDMMMKQATIYRQSNPGKAISLYEEVIRLDKENVKAYTALVELYEAKNEADKAANYLSKLMEISPTLDGNLKLTQLYLDAKDSAKAIEPLERYVAQKKEDLDRLFLLGKLYLTVKQDDKAALVLERIYRESASNKSAFKGDLGQLYEAYATTLIRTGKKDEAVKIYEAAVKLNPNLGEAWFYIAASYLGKEKWSDAISALQKVKAFDLHKAEVTRGLAKAYYLLKNYQQAVIYLEELYKETPSDTGLVLKLVKSYLELRQAAQAAVYLKLLPDDIVVREFSGDMQAALAILRTGNDKLGKTLLLSVLERNPKDESALRMLADLEIKGKNHTAAADALNKLYQLRNQPGIQKEIGDLFLAAGDESRAADAYAIYIKSDAKDRKTLEALLSIYEKQKNVEKAYPLLKILAGLVPKQEEYHYKKGMIEFEQGNLKEAANSFSEVAKLNPKYPKIAYYLGETQYRLGNSVMAEPSLNKALQENPDDSLLLSHLAMTLAKNKKYGEAIPLYEKLLKLRPGDKGILESLIALYESAQSSPDKMIAVYTQYLEIAGKNKKTLSVLAGLYMEVKNFDKALASYEEIYSLDNQDRVALKALVDLYDMRKDIKKASEKLEALLLLSPSAQGNARLAAFYMTLKDSVAAIAPLERYTAVQKAALPEMVLLARCYLVHKDYDKAEVVIRKVLSLKPKDGLGDIYLVLAVALEGVNKSAEAVSAYEQAVKYDSKNGEAFFKIGQFYLSSKKWKESVTPLLNAVNLNTHREEAITGLAEAYYQGGDLKSALPYLEKVNVQKSGQALVLERLVNAYIAVSDDKNAVKYLNELNRLDPSRFEASYLAAMAFILQKDDKSALPILEKYVERNAKDGKGLRTLADLYKRVKQDKKASDILERLYVLKAEPELKKEIGDLLADSDPVKASESYEVYLKVHAADKGVLLTLKKIYESKNNRAALYPVLEKLVVAEPLNAVYLAQKGKMDFEAKRYKEASDAYLRVMKVNAKDGDGAYVLGESYYNLNQFVAAEPYLGAAVAQRSEDLNLRLHYAQVLEKTGKGKSAAAEYEKVLTGRPNDGMVVDKLIGLYESANDPVRLIVLYNKKMEVSGKKDKDLLLKLGGVYRSQKRNDEALSTYEAVLGLDENNETALMMTTDLYEEKKDLKKAALKLEKLLTMKASPQSNLRLAGYFIALQDSARAISPLEVYTASKNADIGQYLLLGLCYRSIKQTEKAEYVLNRIAVSPATGAPNNVRNSALTALYDIYRAKNDKENLKKVLTSLVLLNPKNEAYQYELGSLYYEAKVFEPALKFLLAAHALKPNMESSAKMIGTIYFVGKAYPKALSFLKAALEKDPKDVELHGMLGFAYAQDKATASLAAAEYGTVLTIKPDDSRAARALVDIYEKNQQSAKLMEAYETLLRLESSDKAVWRKFAALAQAQKAPDKAEKALLKLAELDPKNSQTEIQLGELYEAQKKSKEAVLHYGKAIALNAEKPAEYERRIGFIYLNDKNLDSAAAHLYKAVESDPYTHDAAYQLGILYENKKDYEQAVSFFDLAQEAQPENAEYVFRSGRASFRLNEYPAAKQKLLRAVSLNAKLDEAYYMIGQVFLAQDNAKQAAAYFAKAIQLKPDNLDYLKQLADADYRSKLFTEAVPLYVKLLATKPDDLESHANLGRCYLVLKAEEKAVKEFDLVMANKPQLVEEEFEIGRLYYNLKRGKEAKRILNNVLRTHPENADAQEMIADIFLADKDVKNAIDHYLEAAKSDKNRFDLLKKAADLYLSIKNEDKAVSTYESYLSQKKDPEVAKNLSDIYRKNKNEKDLRRILVLRASMNPKEVSTWMELAQLDLKNEKIEDAVNAFNQVLKVDPANKEALYLSGKIYLDQKSYPTALIRLAAAVKLNPGSLKANLALATCYYDTKVVAQAIPLYAKVLQLDPKNESALDKLIELYRIAGNQNELGLHLKKKIEMNPKAGDAYLELAGLYLKVGKAAEAEASFKKGLELKGESFDAFKTLARLFFTQNRLQEAVDYYKKAIYINSKDAEVYQELGKVYLAKKDSTSALDAYEKVLVYQKDNIDALEMVGQLYLAMNYQKKAIGTLQRIIEMKPKSEAGYKAIGKAYLDTKEYDKAENHLKKALSLNPSNPETYYYLGELYRVLNRNEQALLNYEKAFKLQPGNREYAAKYAEAHYTAKNYAAAIPILLKLQQDGAKEVRITAVLMDCFLSIGKPNEAIKYIEVLEKADPAQLKKNFKVAEAFYKLGRMEQALLILEDMGPQKNKDYYQMLADIYTDKKQYGKALEALKALFAQDKSNMKVGLQLGDLYEKRAEDPLAIEVYKDLEVGYPREAVIKERLLALYKRAGYEKASDLRVVLMQLIRLKPDNINYLFELANLQYSDGQRGEAAANLSKVLSAKPGHPGASALYGRILFEQKNYVGAEKYLLNALKTTPNDIPLNKSLGMLYKSKQNLAKARLFLENAYKGDAKDMETVTELVGLYEALKMTDQLTVLYQQLLKSDSKNPIAHRGLGNMYYSQKKYDEAILEYTLYLAVKEDDVEILNLQADLLLKKNKTQEAINYLRSSLRFQANQPEVAFKLGKIFLTVQGNEEAAKEKFEQVVLIDPKNYEAYKMLAVLYKQDNDLFSAIRCLKSALKINSSDPGALKDLAVLMLKQGDLEKAEPVLKVAVRANPTDYDLTAELGRLYVNSRRPAEAEPYLVQAYAGKPNDIKLMMELIGVYNKNNKSALAIPILDKLARSGQATNEVKMQLGIAYYGQGNIEKSKQILEEILTKVDGTPDAIATLGMIYVRDKSFKKAKIVFKKLLEVNPGNIDANFNLGEIAFSEKDYDLAVAHYELVAATDQGYKNLAERLAECYVNQQNIPKAKLYLEKAIQQNPKNPTLFLGMGKVLYMDKNYVQAVTYLKQAESLMPTNDEPVFYQLMCLLGKNQAKEALQMAKASLTRFKTSPTIYYAIGMTYLSARQGENARKAFLIAIKHDPAYKDAYKKIGDVYFEYMNDSAAAIANYKRFLSLGGDIAEIPAELQMKIQ